MAEGKGVDEGRIRSYLADQGGSVEDPGGRGLTDEMARAIGLDKPAALSALLAQMEQDGAITREMRGLRTFRIALTEGASGPPPAGPADAGSVVENGSGAQHRDPAGGDKVPVPSEGRAVSLREALARRPAAASEPEAGAPPAAPLGAPAPAPRGAPAPPPAAAPPEPAAAGAVSLRDAISRQGAGAAPARPGRSYGRADTPPPAQAPSPSPSPPAQAPQPPPPAVAAATSSTGPADRPEPPARKQRLSRPSRKLSLPEPAVDAPPSSILLTAVIVAATGLILLAIILVVVAQSGKHVPVNETVPLSSDACNVVNPDLATSVLGSPAGPPHFVLGECVYDNGTDELIVEVFRQNARTLFDNGHGSSAQDVPGLGDGAYYADGSLRVIKGTSLLEVALGPTPAPTAPPKLVKLASDALARL